MSLGPRTTTIAIGVMGHIERVERAHRLADEVGAEVLSIDHGELGENGNGDRAWRLLQRYPVDWCVVLQDDAIPVPNFREEVANALSFAREGAVGLYVGTGRPYAGLVEWSVQRANAFDASWLEGDDMLWGVGVAIQPHQINPFLDWAKNSTLRYDRRIGAYWKSQGQKIRYTWPSLVNHDDEIPTIAQRGRRIHKPVVRVAHRVGVRDSWDGPTVRLGA